MPLFKKKEPKQQDIATLSETIDNTTFVVQEDPALVKIRKGFHCLVECDENIEKDIQEISLAFFKFTDLWCQATGVDVAPFCDKEELSGKWCLGWSRNGVFIDLFLVKRGQLYEDYKLTNYYDVSCVPETARSNSRQMIDSLETVMYNYVDYYMANTAFLEEIMKLVQCSNDRADYLKRVEEYERPSLCPKR